NSFFFQAEDGIRDFHVTGVQTCALPILLRGGQDLDFRAPPQLDLVAVSMPVDALSRYAREIEARDIECELRDVVVASPAPERARSEERRVGKESVAQGWR